MTPKQVEKALAKSELHDAINDVFMLVMGLPQRRPNKALPRRLKALFQELADPGPARPADEVEEMIWALWISHKDSKAAADMAAGVEAMTAGAMDLAEAVFDRLIAEFPDWAEAWNKRAILAFIARDDTRAIRWIEHALLLEPRHFGAIAGFGQICLRQGYAREASASFQMALHFNPHLQGVRAVIDEIDTLEGPMH